MAKQPTISADMKRIKKLLNYIPEDKKPLACTLFDELVFMQETMAVLKQQVREEGGVSLFQNGKQEFLKEHPALTAYNKTTQRYLRYID